jgi:membrane fusion protein (multidrug efflux system)
VSPNTDHTSGTIEIRAHIDNPEYRIKGGQKANVSVSTNKVDRVVVLPKKVLVFQDNKSYVFVVYKNQARLTEVTLGEETEDGNIQVYGDLRVDDPIVVNRPAELKDGSFVKTVSL